MDDKEKARLYDEALERARKFEEKFGGRDYVEYIFPELSESEDEKVRKEIIEVLRFVPSSMWEQAKTNYERCLAYLEKQKGLDKMIVVTPEVWDKAIADAYENGKKDGKEQKEQKSIIQDVELNDAVYDYVRDHFIAGADFTPEYIKKLMENAFFAGVDYYLLKHESESCESDTNVEKVIEDVIRVYGKTQGEWVGGYDVDTLIVNLRRAFNKKEQKPAEWSEEDEAMLKEIISFFKDGSVKLQHDLDLYAGFLEKRLKSLRPQPKQEWSDKEQTIIEGACNALEIHGHSKLADKLKSLCPSWKPSEEQMKHLERCFSHGHTVGLPNQHVLESLYNDLKKLM